MASSHSKLLFVFFFLFASLFSTFPVFCGFNPRRHLPPPWFYRYDDVTDDYKPQLRNPWISIHNQHITQTLANTTGFRIASGILEKLQLTSLLLVDEIHIGSTLLHKIFIPNCDGITIYIPYLENEDEILDKNPKIIEEIISGERPVLKQLVKKVMKFDASGNISVCHPYIYSDDEASVVVHGVDFKGFFATEMEIDKLSVSPPRDYLHDYMYRRINIVYGVNGFKYWELPLLKYEEDFIKKSEMKIEMVIVASVVPTVREFHHSEEYDLFKDIYTPYKLTMIYTLHF